MAEFKKQILRENVTFSGVVTDIIQSGDSYTLFSLKTFSMKDGNGKDIEFSEKGCKSFSCFLPMPKDLIQKGQKYTFFGNLIFNEIKRKKALEAFCIKTDIPTTYDGTVDFLARHIKGVGQTTAVKIVDTFGPDTFDIIENSPEQLCEIKGISIGKASKIHAEYITKIGTRDDMIWFNQHKITNFKIIAEIKQKYKGLDYKKKIADNPYILINDIDGIGFKKADDIAEKFGIAKDSPFRMAAAIKCILENSQNFGHVYATREKLLEDVRELTHVYTKLPEEVLDRLLEKDEAKKAEDPVCFINLIDDNGAIYETSMYLEECKVAKDLVSLQKSIHLPYVGRKEDVFKRIDSLVKRMHSDSDFSLDISQKEAIYNSISSPISIITGGPGTGKTTTLNTILAYLEEYLDESDFVLLAPTGKAAKRMSEQTKRLANTIHKAVGFGSGQRKQITGDTVIIDEMSMTDMHIMSMLLKSITNVKHLIFVGDVDQLPSVGCGNILKDIIESHVFPVSRLNVIHRQVDKSGIIKYSHSIINEHMFPVPTGTEDFVFMSCNDSEQCKNTVVDLYRNRIPKYLKEKGLDPESIQILAPYKTNKARINTPLLNNIIQKENADAFKHRVLFYKDSKTGEETFYYEGDKVMHTKNDYDLARQKPDGTIEKGVMNGETGTVIEVDDVRKTMTVQYGDDFVAYTKDTYTEVMLAYALTIHKSQGSEYACVIIPITQGGDSSIMNKNLLYTATTRAKNLVILIGNKNIIAQVVHTKYSEKRNTKLQQRLIEANGGVMLWS